MMMRDEHVPEFRKRYTGKGELARDPIAAIDHVCRVVRHDYLCRRRVGLPRARSAAGAEEDQPGLGALPLTPARKPCCTRQRGGADQKCSSVHTYSHVSLLSRATWLRLTPSITRGRSPPGAC